MRPRRAERSPPLTERGVEEAEMSDQPANDRNSIESVDAYNDGLQKHIDDPNSLYEDPEAFDAGERPRRKLASFHRTHHHSHHRSSGSHSSSSYSDRDYHRSSDSHSHSSYDDYARSSDRRYSDRYGDGYSRSSDRYSSGSYGDGYHSSSGHRSSSRDYDDRYYSSSGHHSSSRGYDDGYYTESESRGRLASHHRPRHHHHSSQSTSIDPNYVSSLEAVPIDMSRDDQSVGIEMDRTTPASDWSQYSAQSASAAARTSASAIRAEDTYYADYTASQTDKLNSGYTAGPTDTYNTGYASGQADTHYSDHKSGQDDTHQSEYTPSSYPQSQNRAPGQLASTVAAASALNPPPTHDASKIESANIRRQKTKIKRRKTVLGVLARILIVLIVLIAAGIGGLVYLRAHGQKSMTHDAGDVELTMQKDNTPDDVEEIEDEGKTITYKGEKYRWNDNISTVLFLGSDRSVKQQEEQESIIGKNGQADTILLGIIDNTNKKISFINVNRDTMTNVSQYTPDGDYAGDKQMQICLAYSYGKDNEEGCEMMASTVSNLLYGIPIDSYARISYDAVPMLNDSVGGVTVKVLEDMTGYDPALVKDATVTLNGKQAAHYIRERNMYVLETNELRVARQKQYFYAFMHRTIEATRQDLTLPIGLYNNAKPYMTTSITVSQVTYLTSKVLEYGVEDGAIHSVPGSSIDGANGLVEFHVDETSLYELILNTFYNKVKK